TNSVDGLTCGLGHGEYSGPLGVAASARAASGCCCAVADERPVSALTNVSNSRRANASRLQISGGCAGEVPPRPASGLRIQSIVVLTTLTTAVNRFGRDGAGGVAAAVNGWLSAVSDGVCAASERASAKTATLAGVLRVSAGPGSSSASAARLALGVGA